MLVGYCNDCADCRDLRKAPANLNYNLDALRSQTPEPPPTPCPEHAVEVSPDSSPSKYSASSSHEDAESVTSVSIAYAQEIVAVAGKTETSAADALKMIDELARHRARDLSAGLPRDKVRENTETLYLLDTLHNGHMHAGHYDNRESHPTDFESGQLLKDLNDLVLRRIYAQQSGIPRDIEADKKDALALMDRLEKHHMFMRNENLNFTRDILDIAQPPIIELGRRNLAQTAIEHLKKLTGRRLRSSSASSTLVNEQAHEPNTTPPGLLDLYLQSFNVNTRPAMAPPGLLDAHLQSLHTDAEQANPDSSQSRMQGLHEIRQRAMARTTRSRQEFADYAALAGTLQNIHDGAAQNHEEDDFDDQQSARPSKPSKLVKFFGEPAAAVAGAVARASAPSQRVSIHNNTTQHQSTKSGSTKRFELENYGLSGGREDTPQTARTAGQVLDHAEVVPQIAIMSSNNATQGTSSSDQPQHNSFYRLNNATSNSRIAEHNARILETTCIQQQLQIPASARFSSTASYYTDDGSEYRESAFVPPLSLTHAATATYDAYNADRGSVAVSPPPGSPHPHFNPYHARFDSQGQLEHAAFGAQFDQTDCNIPAVLIAPVATMAQFDHVDTTVQPRFMPQSSQRTNRSPSPVRQRENFVGNLTGIGQNMMYRTMSQQQAMLEQQRQLQLQMQDQMQTQMQAQMQQMQQAMAAQVAQVQAQMREMAIHSENYANAHYAAITAEQEAEIMALTADLAHLQAETARARAEAGQANAEAEFVRSTSKSYPNVQLQPAPAGRRGCSLSPRRLAFRTLHASTHSSPTCAQAGSSNVVLPGTTFEGMQAYNNRRAAAGLPRWASATSVPPTPSWAGSANWADYAYGVDYPTDEE